MKNNGKIKKTILATLLTGALAFTGYQAVLANPHGNTASDNPDYVRTEGDPPRLRAAEPPKSYVDTIDSEALDKFFAATVAERKEHAQKRAEMRALMKSTNPDVKLAGKLAGELFDLREVLLKKAKENGLSVRDIKHLLGGMGDGAGRGHDRAGGWACPKRQ